MLTAIEVDFTLVAAQIAEHAAQATRRGLELHYAAFVAVATAGALQRYPLLNSAWTDEYIVLRRRICFAVALSRTNGAHEMRLVRDAQDLNVRGIARVLGNARYDAQNGVERDITFMIDAANDARYWSGNVPVTHSSSAVLSLGAIQMRPVVITTYGIERVVTRPVGLLTLTFDARMIDLATANAFLAEVRYRLEQPPNP
jgi:pyruvate/2-oxoglutarate dehydrogenase complex dihydrolipoamide acyltransferase (E2) component